MTNSQQEFDQDKFIRAAGLFREQLETEEHLAKQAERALTVVGEAAMKLVAVCRDSGDGKGPVITARISGTVVQVSGGGRNLAFAVACGAASDHRVHHPRAQACSQILVFAHLTGQGETTLLSSFRVYSDGECTDNEISWNVGEGAEAFLPHLAQIVQSAIFESNLYWPAPEHMPGFLQKVPLLEEELHEDTLKRPCVGFECNLKR